MMYKWFRNQLLRFRIHWSIFRPSHVDVMQIFFREPCHGWILQSKELKSSLIEFFAQIPIQKLFRLICLEKTRLLLGNNYFTCCFRASSGCSAILIFPNLTQRLVSSDYRKAYAILAHEFGHIYYRHFDRQIKAIDAQIEADYFAWQLGLGEELANELRSFPKSAEVKLRLSALHKRIAFSTL